MVCDRCDFVSENENDFFLINEENLCEDCFTEEYFVCEVCADVFSKKDMSIEDNVCFNCQEE